MTDIPNTASADAVTLAVELTAAWLSNPNSRADPDAVPTFLTTIHASLVTLAGSAPATDDRAAEPAEYFPAVTVRKSLASPDRIISMIDGKPYRTLRRHLSTHGLTPAEYRDRYKLKADYPMVAPAYSQARSDMAKKIGLGRKPASAATAAAEPAPAAAPKPRRKKATAAAE